MKVEPNLFIIGTAKAGTTSLHKYLSQHPEIFMSKVKEPNYFGRSKKLYKTLKDSNLNYSKVKNFDEYLGLFEEGECHKIRGESSVSTIYSSNGVKEISEAFKEYKIIIGLRNPVDRAYSSYMHHVRDGNEKLSFMDALKKCEMRKKEGYTWGYDYLGVGLYSKQLKRVFKTFDPQDVFIYTYDDFNQDPMKILDDVCGFLEVSSFRFNVKLKFNESGSLDEKSFKTFFYNFLFRNNNSMLKFFKNIVPKKVRLIIGSVSKRMLLRGNMSKKALSNEEKAFLIDFYKKDIIETSQIINVNLSHWYEG